MAQQHRNLVANCLAQSRTLMVGRSLQAAKAALLQRGLDESKAAPTRSPPGHARAIVPAASSPWIRSTPARWARYWPCTSTAPFAVANCGGSTPSINGAWNWARKSARISWDGLSGTLNGHGMDAATERLIEAWDVAQR